MTNSIILNRTQGGGAPSPLQSYRIEDRNLEALVLPARQFKFNRIGGAPVPSPTAPPFPYLDSKVHMDFRRRRYFGTNESALTPSNANGGWTLNLDGTMTFTPANTLRFGPYGLRVEIDQTNRLLWSRDLSNTAWTKTNVTVSPTGSITGVDGTANGSRLTATANDGTLSQSYTMPGAAKDGAVSIKRVSGSGTVLCSIDNSQFHDATPFFSAAPSSGWVRPNWCAGNGSGANGTFVLKFGTAGDVFDIDQTWADAQDRGTVSAVSPYPTTNTIVTRAADYIEVSQSSLLYTLTAPGTNHTVLAKVFNAISDNSTLLGWEGLAGYGWTGGNSPTGQNQITFKNGGAQSVLIGDGSANLNACWLDANRIQEQFQTGIHCAGAWACNYMTPSAAVSRALSNNQITAHQSPTVATGAVNHTAATGRLWLGSAGSFAAPLFPMDGEIEEIIVFDRVLSDAEMAAYTTNFSFL